MDEFKEHFVAVLKAAIAQAGSQTKLAKLAGMQQSRISDYLTARYDLDHISIGVLRRIFPRLRIDYGILPGGKVPDKRYEAEIEKRLAVLFRRLSAEDQIRCFEMVSRTFGDKFEENDDESSEKE